MDQIHNIAMLQELTVPGTHFYVVAFEKVKIAERLQKCAAQPVHMIPCNGLKVDLTGLLHQSVAEVGAEQRSILSGQQGLAWQQTGRAIWETTAHTAQSTIQSTAQQHTCLVGQ
jgi:hypothetical protein